MNMYGFTKVKHFKDSQTFEHQTFKVGNEENFHEIGRKSKNRAIKSAKEHFDVKRRDFMDKLLNSGTASKYFCGLLLDSLLYKD